MGKVRQGTPVRPALRWCGHFHSAVLFLIVISACLLELNGETLVFPPYGHSYGIRKATPQHLFMFFGPRTFFDNPQGLATTRLDVWDDPKTEKDDDEVVVYGVNCNRHQIIYNTSMWTLGLYGKRGNGEGCFLYPRGVAADRHGNVIVADSGNDRVVVLYNPKSSLKWVRTIDGAASGMTLKGPTQVGIDEALRIYITDTGNRRVLRCTLEGKVLGSIECSAPPTALAVADGEAYWSFFRNEQALFFAEGKNVLVKTDFSGKPLIKATLPSGYAASYGAIDFYHNYWITDSANCVVIKYDHNLNLLDIFGSCGTGDNQFVEPRGIAIYKRYGQTFIAEKKGAQYYWVGTDLKSAKLSVDPDTSRYTLTVSATEYSFVSLFSIINADTCFYMKKHRIPPGNAVLGIRGKGHDLRAEKMMLKLEPTYSSYTYYSWFFPVGF